MAKNIFNSVLFPKVDTNKFDLSHDVKLSFKMGQLIPTCCMECMPGDKFSISVENMLRFAPLIAPVMHKVQVTTHYFFVPNRILWPEWEDWITGEGEVPAPKFDLGVGLASIPVGSLGDYLGLPIGPFADNEIPVSPLPIGAYLKIWDEYYRDQNLQTEQYVEINSGDNNAYVALANGDPLRRAWMHDYFTSALPFAQKGAAVAIPLTTQSDIPVEFLAGDAGTRPVIRDPDTGALLNGPSTIKTTAASELTSDDGVNEEFAAYDPDGTLVVDVQADATDINTLRRAFRLQEWLERNARGGTRYIENILAHFGVKSSDARLNRPEYLGGSKQNMVISEVLATAENTEAVIAVGNMAGHGISVGGGNRFNYRCEEHGYIIGIINVQPVTAYQEGIHKSWSRFDRLDYPWPTFANIGEQEVFIKELYAKTAGDPLAVFGYVPRYAEMKFMNSRVAGEMRTTLNFWHLGRIFGTTPVLNEDFIESNPSERIFAVTDEGADHIFAHLFNNISVVRKLPKYGIPAI